jgi:protocatechuate 3,4-dioxygenase beta subunit
MMTPVTRRRALTLLGAGGVAITAAACGGGSKKTGATGSTTTSSSTATSLADSATTATTATASVVKTCVLAPEMTEGPYYISGEAVRSDITEGHPGAPLRLALTVVDVTTCGPIPNAVIDVWHADAGGNYSGFGSTSSNRTFLRGTQVSDANGNAGFNTIYPGWYQGRATHIHLKVHVGGNAVHTGQLFFDEATNHAVYANAPYTGHAGNRTLNSQDGIYASGGAQSIPTLTREGSGHVGTITLGVKR